MHYASLFTDHTYEECSVSESGPIDEKMCASVQQEYADSVYKALIVQIRSDFHQEHISIMDSSTFETMIQKWKDSATNRIEADYKRCGMQYYCDVLAMDAYTSFYKKKIRYLALKIYP